MRPRTPSTTLAVSFAGLAVLASGRAGAQPADPPQPMKLDCTAPDEVRAGDDVTIECRVPRGLATRAQIFYRPQGAETYSSVPMSAGGDGVYRGTLSGLKGRSVQFYCEAQDARGSVVAASGRTDDPDLITLRSGKASGSGGGDGADVPALFATATAAPPPHGLRRTPQAFWFGLGVGSGYGWQTTTTLEHRSDLQARSGFAAAALGHLTPEIGYQFTPRVAMSLEGRHQIIPSSGSDPDHPGSAPGWAHSVLLRTSYTFIDGDTVSLFGAAQVGGGEGFRFRFKPDSAPTLKATDTARSGPLLFGPGAGVIFRLTPSLGAVVETNLLAGVPDFGMVADLNVAAQFGL